MLKYKFLSANETNSKSKDNPQTASGKSYIKERESRYMFNRSWIQ
jgi:hypothetical protein